MNQISKKREIIDRQSLIAAIDGVLGDDGYDAAKRADILTLLKDTLAAGQGEVRRRFDELGSGAAVLAGNAYLIDQLIRVIYDVATEKAYTAPNRSTSENISVVAIGGYGRAELAPHSDVDIMFLLPYKPTGYTEQVVEFILYMLWDMNLKVGHSTRSIDECIRLAKQDVTIETSLLDARWLWGDQSTFGQFKQKFQSDVMDGRGPAFVEAKLQERDDRHDRMGDARYVVEPNIKEGKGGLRDLQTLYWLNKYLYRVTDVEELVSLNVFTPQDVFRYNKAAEFLATVRCYLHYIAGRPEERLTFDVQKGISEKMGYEDQPESSGVERFMKHYFLIAKDVGDLTRVLCAYLEDKQAKRSFFRMPGFAFRRFKIDGFDVDQGRITLQSDDAFRNDPLKLLRIFAEAQEHDLDVHPYSLRQISEDLDLIDEEFQNDPASNQLFLDILTSTKEPETALRRMNEAGVFGLFIPDFGRVVAQMQFDMYHTYTVDEHTIRAIGILSRIEAGQYTEEMPNVTEALKKIHSRRALYVAVFMHDIAKGRGGDHSELGAELALELCPRLGLDQEETATVSWLVKEHLTMSDTAFKRDVDDPLTIKNFVSVVRSVERLRLLTVLTCVDIRAVGPNTWNNWKSGLLRGLYQRSLEVMSGDQVEENRVHRIAAAKDRLRDALAGWPAEFVEEHISSGYPSYWLTYDTASHLRHAEIVRAAKDQGVSLYIDSRIDDTFKFSEVTVYAPDHPGIFSKIAGVMAISGVTIMDAKIATLSDGMVLDSFSFLDATDSAVTQDDKMKRIFTRIEDVLSDKLHLQEELEKVKASRTSKQDDMFSVAGRVIVDNNASATDTIIEVTGLDRVGFLYDVTAAITALGLKISSAHITTFGEEAVDSLYVKDVFGLKVTHEDKIKRIKIALLDAVEGGQAPAVAAE